MSELTDFDKGVIAGVAFAAGYLANSHNEDFLAEQVIDNSGFKAEDFRYASAYDLSQIRKGSSDLREFLKGVKGKN